MAGFLEGYSKEIFFNSGLFLTCKGCECCLDVLFTHFFCSLSEFVNSVFPSVALWLITRYKSIRLKSPMVTRRVEALLHT